MESGVINWLIFDQVEISVARKGEEEYVCGSSEPREYGYGVE
jgi:hypothetical protein